MLSQGVLLNSKSNVYQSRRHVSTAMRCKGQRGVSICTCLQLLYTNAPFFFGGGGGNRKQMPLCQLAVAKPGFLNGGGGGKAREQGD